MEHRSTRPAPMSSATIASAKAMRGLVTAQCMNEVCDGEPDGEEEDEHREVRERIAGERMARLAHYKLENLACPDEDPEGAHADEIAHGAVRLLPRSRRSHFSVRNRLLGYWRARHYRRDPFSHGCGIYNHRGQYGRYDEHDHDEQLKRSRLLESVAEPHGGREQNDPCANKRSQAEHRRNRPLERQCLNDVRALAIAHEVVRGSTKNPRIRCAVDPAARSRFEERRNQQVASCCQGSSPSFRLAAVESAGRRFVRYSMRTYVVMMFRPSHVQTCSTFGLTIPQSLLLRDGEVIERTSKHSEYGSCCNCSRQKLAQTDRRSLT